jgi:hypothetical protein
LPKKLLKCGHVKYKITGILGVYEMMLNDTGGVKKGFDNFYIIRNL